MKRMFSLLPMLALLGSLVTLAWTSPGTNDTKESIKGLFEEINAQGMPLPPSTFKTGHVNRYEYNDYLKPYGKGFVIKLPSNTNVPTPGIQGDRLFTGGGFGSKEFFCFNAKTGEKNWSVTLDDDGPSSAVIEEDVLVFNTESCTIFALDAKTGQYLWSHWLGDPLMSMPAVANGKVFTAYPAAFGKNYNGKKVFGSGSFTLKPTHAFAAFDLKTGKILWQKWIDGDVMSAPVAIGDEVYFSTFPGTLFRMDQKTGDFLTVSALRCTSAPVVEGDKVFVTCRSDEGNACSESVATLDKNTFKTTAKFLTKQATYLDKTVQSGSKLKEESMILDSGNGFSGGAPGNSGWEAAYDNIGQSNVSSLQAFQGSRILMIGGKTYNTMGDELICSDPGNGKKLWTTLVEGDMHRTGGHLATPPIKAGNYLIVATYSGEVIVYNPENGRVAEKFRTAGDPIRYAPIAHEGWIYVTTTTGKLYGFKSDNPNITGWPMWGANPGHTNTVN